MILNEKQIDSIAAPLVASASWAHDMGEKHDFDFGILQVSCRSYGPSYNKGENNPKYSCYVIITLPLIVRDEYLELFKDELFAYTEEELRLSVSAWVRDKVNIMHKRILAGHAIADNDLNAKTVDKMSVES